MDLAHTSSLPYRVQDYFRRQIACFEEILADLERLEHDLGGPDAPQRIQLRLPHERRTAALEREFTALAREWRQAAELPKPDRADIRALAQTAQALAEEVCAAYQRGIELATTRSAEVKADLGDLRRGRDVLQRYRTTQFDVAFFDRRA